MKLAIIIPSTLPVPSVKGGAIETLMNGLVEQNELQKLLNIYMFSPYDKKAKTEAKKYKYTHFIWIKYSLINKIINLITRSYSKFIKNPIPHFGILQIIYHVKKLNPDLLVIEGNIDMIYPLYKVVGKDKIFFHLHAATLFDTPETYNYCNKIIVVSNFLKKEVLFRTKRREEDIIVIHNCIDINKFNRDVNIRFRDEIRFKYGIKNKEIIICFVGRIEEGKGVKELIEALLLIPEEINYKLLIVGSAGLFFGEKNCKTKYYKEVLTLADKLKNKVIFTGFIHNNHIPRILASSDISIIPSVHKEAHPLVVIESLAAGLPVITTDSGGIKESITEDCAISININKDFVLNLSSAIRELLICERKREEMGKAGAIHAQKFNLNNYYENFIKIVNDK